MSINLKPTFIRERVRKVSHQPFSNFFLSVVLQQPGHQAIQVFPDDVTEWRSHTAHHWRLPGGPGCVQVPGTQSSRRGHVHSSSQGQW